MSKSSEKHLSYCHSVLHKSPHRLSWDRICAFTVRVATNRLRKGTSDVSRNFLEVMWKIKTTSGHITTLSVVNKIRSYGQLFHASSSEDISKLFPE